MKEGPIGAMISQSIELPQELTGLTEIMVNMFEKGTAPKLEDMNLTMRPKSAERILVSEAGSRKKIAFLGVEHDAKMIMYNMFARVHRQICKETGKQFEDSMVPRFLLKPCALKARNAASTGNIPESCLGLPEPTSISNLIMVGRSQTWKEEQAAHRSNLQEGRAFVECAKRLGILEIQLFARSSLKLTTRVHRTHADTLAVDFDETGSDRQTYRDCG